MNHQMALPGLSWCILILVVLISKCYTLGMFLLLLFCFRTLMKLCLRAVNEAIIDWRYFMTPEMEITQRLNWQKYYSFQFTQFSFYFFEVTNAVWFSFVLAWECYNILCPWNHRTLTGSHFMRFLVFLMRKYISLALFVLWIRLGDTLRLNRARLFSLHV